MSTHERRPWFGPKRIGWGLRPQSWQGWAVMVVLAVAVVLIALLASR